MHDGSSLMIKKLEHDYDPTDKMAALQMLEQTCCKGILVTGLIYFNEDQDTLHDVEDLVDTPLVNLPLEKLRPSKDSLDRVIAAFR